MDAMKIRRDALAIAIIKLDEAERDMDSSVGHTQSNRAYFRSNLEQARFNYLETLAQAYEDNKDEIMYEINDIDARDHA